ncbi:MAG: TetR/AcrR family transcriptional regulator [Candidatus Coproplasma sp.]
MPPKPKFTKEQIIKAAYEITRRCGIEGVTANELKSALGTSASPIFTLFSSIEEIKGEVRRYAMELYSEDINRAYEYKPAFKQFGNLMISYAQKEPHVFKLLFMQKSERESTYDEMMERFGDGVKECIPLIQKDYGLNEKQAKLLFKQIWLYAYSLSALCANGVCTFTPQEINQMIGQQFMATFNYIVAGKGEELTVIPEKTVK